MYRRGLDLVVVNYRTGGDLWDFLRSFDDALTTWPADRPWSMTIVNVDPQTHDNLVAERWIAMARQGEVLALSTANRGFAVAANHGAYYGRRDTLAIFNADVVLRPGALEACLAALWSDDTYAILGPKQVDMHNRITAAGIFGTPEQPAHRGWQEIDRGQYDDVRDDAVYAAGSAFFTKRAIWDELTVCPLFQEAAPGAKGALLETCFLMFEESYLCRHAAEHGYKIVYYGLPDGRIIHKWHRSIKKHGIASSVWEASKQSFRTALDIHGAAHE